MKKTLFVALGLSAYVAESAILTIQSQQDHG